MYSLDVNIMTTRRGLIAKYKKYIDDNYIPNNHCLDAALCFAEENRYIYETFLDECNQKKNKTYYYFKAVYYFSIQEYEKVILLGDSYGGSHMYYMIGLYYDSIIEDFILMKKYYDMAIELDNTEAMLNIAHYYQDYENNYELRKAYNLMGAKLNNPHAMVNLAMGYRYEERNYDLMKKYLLMAIEFGCHDVINNLADYYMEEEKNYTLAKKYYAMAIDAYTIYPNDIRFKKYCREIEKDEQNFYRYIYFPRILSLILISIRIQKKHNIHHSIFLPEELYIYIFNKFILK